MYSRIYTYTLIRCLYNKGEDYIDSFYPLIINVLPLDKTGSSLETIQEEIKSKFNLTVPIHSLSIIATRAKRKGFLKRYQRKCYLTDEGVKFVSTLESERDEVRRINEFVEEAQTFLKKTHSIKIPKKQIELIIEKVVKENIEIFEPFLGGSNHSEKPPKENVDKFESEIIDFLFYVENSKPHLFKTLQDIIIGGIISSIIYTDSLEEPDKKLDNIRVFLDSNYMFSLLGMRYIEQNKPALELFELIKSQQNIELRIFDFTIEEMINVLKKYQNEQFHYPDGVKIDSLYSSLKSQGWTSADVKEFIVNIENKLTEYGIRILSTPIDIKKYEPSDPNRKSNLQHYKDEQGTREQNHDLAAIDQIVRFRRGRRTKIENCDALFLTSDLKLSKFNYYEDKHKKNGTISEVIPDKLFTNLLWLKNPTHDKEIHLTSWISLNTRHFFIDRSVWSAFYKNLKILRDEGKINDTDISILIYDNHIQEILKDTDPSDIHNIEAEWILDNIMKAKERLNKKHQGEIKNLAMFFDEEIKRTKKEVEFISKEKKISEQKLDETDNQFKALEQRVKELENEKKRQDENLIETIIKWKKKQEIQSETIAKRWLNIISYTMLFFFFIALFSFASAILNNWDKIEPIAFIVTLGVTITLRILGKKYDPFQLHFKIYDKIFNKVYEKKLKQIKDFELKI
ncbi:MAG: hypothetical protein AB7W47_00260 [Calditrichaceae bacterium]